MKSAQKPIFSELPVIATTITVPHSDGPCLHTPKKPHQILPLTPPRNICYSEASKEQLLINLS
jgi:hypothetical protein